MSGPSTISELLAAALDGDQEAWDRIVDGHRSLVWAVVVNAGLVGDDADDAFQMTFIRLLERGRSVREPERLPGWLATTARNEARNVQRRRRRSEPVDDFSELADEVDGGPDRGVMVDATVAAVRLALAELSERCQQLLRLLFTEPPLGYDEIGEILGIPVGSIGPTRMRCMERLRRSPHLRGVR